MCIYNNQVLERKIVTKVAYLIGVDERFLSNAALFDNEEYEAIKTDEHAVLMRTLTSLRMTFMVNGLEIQKRRRAGELLEDIGIISKETIIYLRKKALKFP